MGWLYGWSEEEGCGCSFGYIWLTWKLHAALVTLKTAAAIAHAVALVVVRPVGRPSQILLCARVDAHFCWFCPTARSESTWPRRPSSSDRVRFLK